jgi:uncharacterized SAM-binding protein YcdF (DUF218 family)
LLVLFVFAVVTIFLTRRLHSFLAVTAPVTGGVLVVEGWAPDYAMAEARDEFRRGSYPKIYVVGGPLEWGAPLSEYKTYAERGAAVLVSLGLTTNDVQAVPAPIVQQDRTYSAARSLRSWVQEHGETPTKVHLISEGPHARRSRLLFQKALGPSVQVGVTAVPVRDYDEKHWWRSSGGVRGVIGELLAYGYARVLFRPPKDKT